MGRYARFGLIGCGGLALLFVTLLVGIVIGGNGTSSTNSGIEENEAEQDGANQGSPSEAEPAPEMEPLEFIGTGSQATEVFTLPAGLARFESSHDGESNFIVYLLDESGNEDLVFSEIGATTASQVLRIPEDGEYLLNVDADGAWTIAVR